MPIFEGGDRTMWMGAWGNEHGDKGGSMGKGAWIQEHGDGSIGMGARGWEHGDSRVGQFFWLSSVICQKQ